MTYKKSILAILIVSTLLSCKSNDTKTDPIFSNEWQTEIKLDGTSKWVANEETSQGVQRMLTILENTEVGEEMDFKTLGTELKSEINTVIKECSMKGPSHDNLHIFLMPLIEKVDALQKPNDVERNKALVASIFYNLKAYDTYFK